MPAATLTEDQARLLHEHCGTWMVAATIVDTDYGMASMKARQGGRCWPAEFHPELPYNHTGVTKTGIRGYTVERSTLDDNPSIVAVSYAEVKRWAGSVPEYIVAELRLQFGLMARERDRTMNWCYCPWKDTAPNAHSDPCTRYHPTDSEDRQRRDVADELDHRQETFVLIALGLTSETPKQLDLFEAS